MDATTDMPGIEEHSAKTFLKGSGLEGNLQWPPA